jgi:Right handed beta helix region
VTLDGANITGTTGTNGIVFNAGGSLTVNNCVVQNFSGPGPLMPLMGNGILMQPVSGAGPISFVITNTVVSNNAYVGIYYQPPSGSAQANGVIDHVVVTNNQYYGIQLNTVAGGGATTVAISNSIDSNNGNTGIYFANASSSLQGSIDNSTISGNGASGVDAELSSDLEIGRSVITYNGTGVLNNTSPNRVFSYGDNRINSNAPNIGGSNGTTLASHALQ